MPKPENLIGKGFDKNPQNINKKGVPPKVLKSMLEYFEAKYGQRPAKGEVISLLSYVESLPQGVLKDFVNDETTPAAVAAYGRLILTGDQKDYRRCLASEMINDRLHGKPKQSTDITSDGEKIDIIVKFEGNK
jgi:hypothetical protein